MEEFVRCLITKPSKVFNRYFGPEHGVELSQPKRYGYTPVEFADESEPSLGSSTRTLSRR